MATAESQTRNTRDEYVRMAEAGVFGDRRVELIDGVIYERCRRKRAHTHRASGEARERLQGGLLLRGIRCRCPVAPGPERARHARAGPAPSSPAIPQDYAAPIRRSAPGPGSHRYAPNTTTGSAKSGPMRRPASRTTGSSTSLGTFWRSTENPWTGSTAPGGSSVAASRSRRSPGPTCRSRSTTCCPSSPEASGRAPSDSIPRHGRRTPGRRSSLLSRKPWTAGTAWAGSVRPWRSCPGPGSPWTWASASTDRCPWSTSSPSPATRSRGTRTRWTSCSRCPDRPVLYYRGRLHSYQGYSGYETVFPVRLAVLLGIKVLILTNATGGLRPRSPAGRPGADQRPPQPDRDQSAARPAPGRVGAALPGHDRGLRSGPARPRAPARRRARRPAERRRLRRSGRTDLRDPGRGADAPHPGRGRDRHVHRPRGHRRPPHGSALPRHLDGQQPRGRA